MKTQYVKDWMTHHPLCARVDMPLPEAHKLMESNKIRRLPILDANARLVGIVTRGDIRGAQASEATSLSIFELNYLLSRLHLDHVMSKFVITVRPNTTIREAARLMLQHKIAGLPVVDAGQVVGILTESDIFRMVVRMWEQEDPVMAEYA